MKEIYGIETAYIFDNHVCRYNKEVFPLSEVDNLNLDNVVFIFTLAKDSENFQLLMDQLNEKKLEYYELKFPYYDTSPNVTGKVGRHSYGDIITTYSINFCESIGAFCSFAEGTRLVQNHATEYMSTSPFIYHDKAVNDYLPDTFEDNKNCEWYIEGIKPKGIIPKAKKLKLVTMFGLVVMLLLQMEQT